MDVLFGTGGRSARKRTNGTLTARSSSPFHPANLRVSRLSPRGEAKTAPGTSALQPGRGAFGPQKDGRDVRSAG